jgi:hypothetical protein
MHNSDPPPQGVENRNILLWFKCVLAALQLPLWYLQTLLKDMLDCAQKYLLLLDQTILIHFRSSIDRPLSLPQFPGKINKTQLLLKYFLVHEVLNFLKNDGKMFKYYNRLDGVLMLKKGSNYFTSF